MERYPDIESLANSNEDEVLSYWSGLGYYSRGRNLLKAARMLKRENDSVMPKSSEELQLLPGIGRSTAGAILSLGFKNKAPILDGNAKRVFVRYFLIRDSIDLTSTSKKLWKIAEDNLPDKECDIYTQAIMDVGALICKRTNPKCLECPLNKNCLAFKKNKQQSLPIRSPKKEKPIKKVHWLMLQNIAGEFLLENRTAKGVWEGLWTFLEFEEEHARKEYIKSLPKDYAVLDKDIKIKHTFSHYKLDINLLSIKIKQNIQNFDNNKVWFNTEELKSVGLPSPVSKILNEIK
tara:strand:- start:315 stop:1187 length:873 start_codon:yes stop_codon:yes gene_type:complete